jgi:hypothetical protein
VALSDKLRLKFRIELGYAFLCPSGSRVPSQARLLSRAGGWVSPKVCLFVSEPSKPERKRGLPDLGTLAFSYPIRCEPTPLEPLDHLSNLVPLTAQSLSEIAGRRRVQA